MHLLNCAPESALSLVERVEALVRRTTHGRIRGLAVEEIQGRFMIRGQVPSHHTKQLALHAALELLPSESFCAQITVG